MAAVQRMNWRGARVEVRNPAMRLLLHMEEPEGQRQLGWREGKTYRVTLVVTSEYGEEYLIWDRRRNSNVMAGFQLRVSSFGH